MKKAPEDGADAVAEALVQPRFVRQPRRRLEGGVKGARHLVRRGQVDRIDPVALGRLLPCGLHLPVLLVEIRYAELIQPSVK